MPAKRKTKPVKPNVMEPSGVLRVRATRDGFRRAGRAWSRQGDIVNQDDFTAEQWSALRAEPRLKIEDITAPGDAPETE